jgi:two-component system phosphate regulon sensor histidine kinase PhoR
MHPAILIALLLVLVPIATLYVTRRRRALAQLARGLDALAGGRPVRPVEGRWWGKTGQLIEVFNAVAPRLEQGLTRLERDRQLLETVLEGMSEGVMAVDSRRRLLFANRAAIRFFGLPTGESGRLVAEVVRIPKVQDAIEATLNGQAPHQEEIAVSVRTPERPRGTALNLAIHGTRLPGSPVPGAVLVFHDVTELRRLERMRQDFVANASHELKTPLASIRAYTETLIDGALDDSAVKYDFLHRIDEQADRLHQLILDMLSLARLETGDNAFRHDLIHLLPVVRPIVEAHRTRAQARNHRLTLDADSSFEQALVRADEEAIRQILDNLLDNAINYTPPGGRISVTCRISDDFVVLDVRDTGIGIPREDLPRVFERFFRVDKARSREVGGTGLGLSIVKHLVQSLGGRVSVESRPNAGSTFRVMLPRHPIGSQARFALAEAGARVPGIREIDHPAS